MADVRHLPVVGRKVNRFDYADPHEVELASSDITDALGYTPANAADLAAGLALKADALLVITPVAGTSYTIVPADTYAAKALTNAALVTVVVPNDLAIPVGARCRFGAEGAAGAIVAEAPGVTIINRGNKRAAAQGSIFELHKRAASVWWLLGDVQ